MKIHEVVLISFEQQEIVVWMVKLDTLRIYQPEHLLIYKYAQNKAINDCQIQIVN